MEVEVAIAAAAAAALISRRVAAARFAVARLAAARFAAARLTAAVGAIVVGAIVVGNDVPEAGPEDFPSLGARQVAQREPMGIDLDGRCEPCEEVSRREGSRIRRRVEAERKLDALAPRAARAEGRG